MGIPVFFASHNPSRSLPSPRPVVRARKPNSLALPAGGREPNQSAAPGLAWPDEGARACRVQGANMEGRAQGKRRRGWRGPTVEQGLAGCKAPTWKAARREKVAGVGVARRRSKGLQGGRRQHGRPRAGKKAPKLAWPDGGTRACREGDANMEGRVPEKGAEVGVARRWNKGLPGGRRQPNLSPGRFSASFRSRVRARKPNSLALPASEREPNLSPGCFSASSRSRVCARKPNSLALPAGRCQHARSRAAGIGKKTIPASNAGFLTTGQSPCSSRYAYNA